MLFQQILPTKFIVLRYINILYILRGMQLKIS